MLSTALRTLLATVRKAFEDRAQDMAAAITYYTFFSIFPLLLGLVAIGGFFIDPEKIQAGLSAKLAETLPTGKRLYGRGRTTFMRFSNRRMLLGQTRMQVHRTVSVSWKDHLQSDLFIEFSYSVRACGRIPGQPLQ